MGQYPITIAGLEEVGLIPALSHAGMAVMVCAGDMADTRDGDMGGSCHITRVFVQGCGGMGRGGNTPYIFVYIHICICKNVF